MPRGKQHGKPSNRAKAVEHEIAVKALFDRLDAALEQRDQEEVRATMAEVQKHGRAAAKECERRILKPRSEASALLVDLLRTIPGVDSNAALNRVAKNKTAPDYMRFAARRLIGWETSDVAFQRLKFLDSLRDPTGTLIAVASAKIPVSIDQLDSAEEVLRYLNALPAERRLAVVTEMTTSMPDTFAPLACMLAHVDDPRLQSLVIGWLRDRPSSVAAETLKRVARTTIDPDIRDLATEAAAALEAQPRAAELEQRAFPPFHTALLSSVDSEGEQIAVFIRSSAPGLISCVQMFWDDTTGVRDVFGSSYAPEEYLEDIRDEAEIEGQLLVEVSPDVVRGVYQAALEVSARTGHPLPPQLELWEPFIHDIWPIPADEPVQTAELDDAPYAGRDDLVAASAELLAHEVFELWRFSMLDTMRGMSMADAPKGNGKKLTNAQYEPVIEALTDPFRRRLLRSRLRRQAFVLDLVGAERERDLALAVSASLQSVSIIDMVEHPFLRRMTELSVEMADPLGSVGLGLPGGLGIADLLGGGLGGFPGLGDAWLEDYDAFDDFDDDEEWDEGDEDESVIEVASPRIIEFPKRDDPTS